MAHTLSYLLHALVVLSVSLFLTIDAADPTFLVPIASTAPRSVSENEAPSTSILTLEGQDTDGNPLTFSIVTQTPTSPPFELESVSGLLKVPSGLDAEVSTSYEFVFGVRDGSATTNSVPYVVNIVDVNDNAPVFNPTTYVNTVTELTPNGTSVERVTVTDADVSGNNITFRIVAGNNPAMFALDQTSGELTLSAALNATTKLSFSITIQASDGTWNAATPATVNITVIATGGEGNETGGKCKEGCYIPIIVVGCLICVGATVFLFIKKSRKKN